MQANKTITYITIYRKQNSNFGITYYHFAVHVSFEGGGSEVFEYGSPKLDELGISSRKVDKNTESVVTASKVNLNYDDFKKQCTNYCKGKKWDI